MKNIIIFSKPIHSGKTTSLMHWCKEKKNVKGILMPEVNGTKYFYDIEQKEYFNAEFLNDPKLDDDLQIIGKYHFSNAAFKKANEIIIHALNKKNDLIIIDEIGKLELQEKGFHSSLKSILKLSSDINLLIVVRDTLIKEVTDFYQISHYRIISALDEII
jgi:nucleoside-triphosphatase